MRRRALLKISSSEIDISTAVVTASAQTYTGSALTPSVTVTLNGNVIPSSGYDVTYSNNVNAGTGNITVTGKNGYRGTATGTFTIAKANPTYTAPTANSLTYSGSSQYLTTTGSTSHGTIYYSSDGTNWYTTRRTGTNAGSYTTYWKLTGDSNHSDIASTSISTTIVQATGSVTTAPTARSVTYTGSSQYLVTAGSGTGTMYYRYKLSTSSSWSSWSTTRPSRTTAGTYNVEYYCAASSDGNYTASATGSLNATIAKASRTISFSDVYNVVAPSGTITKTATPSAGSGDGAVTYSISSTTYATINSSTGKVTAKTSEGSATVTATVAEGTNYLSASASYTLYVFATTHNFDYTGSVQSLLLPPGSYTLQVWGAQGGSNAANSTYGITAKAGGKGGYSTGVFTTANEKTVYAFVGGQGSSSGNGGWNGGGGSSTGTSSYSSTSSGTTTLGISTFGCGGGATDIALTTSDMSYSSYRNARSSASLLSRMIVAGGGSGGAMRCTRTTTTTTITDRSVSNGVLTDTAYNSDSYSSNKLTIAGGWSLSGSVLTLTPSHDEQQSSDSTGSQVGYAGGGTTGKGYSSSYYGSQTAAGTNGAFGFGANQSSTSYRYTSGCGGAGWYGGGSGRHDSTTGYVSRSGGGSGWVNTSASAANRPSGYTGIELDSGSTYDGTQTFVSPSGSNETGHAGNGYARITRIS